VSKRDELIRQFLSGAECIIEVERSMRGVLTVESHQMVAVRIIGEELLRLVSWFVEEMRANDA
jgi:hypothetical protein